MHNSRFETLRELERLLVWLVNGPLAVVVKPLLQGLLWCHGRVERIPAPRLRALGKGLQWDVTVSVVPEGQCPGMSEALELERKLWAGHARYALPSLEHLAHSPVGLPRVQAFAAWVVGRWYLADGDDGERALQYLMLARSLHPARRWQPGQVVLECEALLRLERLDEARERLAITAETVAPCSEWYLASANLVRAEGGEDGRRLELLNAMLVRYGLQPLALREACAPLRLANLVGAEVAPLPVEPAATHALISVLMPCFGCADTVETAIRGLLAQTWPALEIVAVDDASDDATWPVLNRLAQEDARVRPVRHASNQGAYAARLTALEQAQGELITVHDADDWSHPEKLALQARALRKDPALKACMSSWCRVGEDLVVRMIGATPGKGYLRENESSLMFRRSLVEEIGAWDGVRAGADTEYIWRIRAAFGQQAVALVKPEVPLSFSLMHDTSLTRTGRTHVRTMFHGSRRIYREAQAWWHRTAGREAFRALPCEPGRRPFFAPPQLLEKAPAPVEVDLVVVADLGEASPEKGAVEASIRRQVMAKRVAVFHWRHYDSPAMQPICDLYQAMAANGTLTIIGPQDRVVTGQARVVGALMAQHRLDDYPAWQCERLVVEAAGLEAMTQEAFMAADAHLHQAFGIRPDWPEPGYQRREWSIGREAQA
ncbi:MULTISPECIES: glycosyltransferase family 2 protein [Halomonadaceae]|uniref:glycosyltransferase family 2 protein n=1 Tax=Halomonadaceae TaxID=28256 RepID=UPI0015839999|nr:MULTISPECIES: glycosyltransferase family A protein [Halomonas]MDI4636237.1 glycosyltransferase family 2 protein [Halomonas sp. BMC7]NUJ60600.1 glycosyltransferase family 2 protein [Halomonas taeanensis]